MAEPMAGPQLGQQVTLDKGTGTIRFIGETSFAAGTWIGIELDNPNGKNDGKVQGKEYFACKPMHGIFIRPEAIAKGKGKGKSPNASGYPGSKKEMTTSNVRRACLEAMGDGDWDNEKASELAATIQAEAFRLVKAAGYKVVVLAEVLAPNTGCAKSIKMLTTADDEVIEVEVQNSKGMTAYVLAVSTRY